MLRSSLAIPAILAASLLNAQLLINEVDYDQPGTDNAEYLELKNPGPNVFPLQFLQVVMVNGSNGMVYRTLSDPSWPSLGIGDYFVICASQAATPGCDVEVTPATNLIQNGSPDAIALLFTSGPVPVVVDALSYGGTVPGYVEGNGTSVEDVNNLPGLSIGRFPDGNDTDDNDADFFLMCSTPGAANVIDPLQCDLSTSVRNTAPVASTFTVLMAPGGNNVLVFDANAAAEPLAFDVFTAEGSLVASRGASDARRTSWSFDAQRYRGKMLLVRLTTPTRQEARRIILP